MLTQLKENLSTELEKIFDKKFSLNKKELLSLLESPKHQGHGQLALPVFFLAKQLRKAPMTIAQELAEELNLCKFPHIQKVEAISGFINFHYETPYLQDLLTSTIYKEGEQLGFSEDGQGKSIVIDYASPNVAKPMSIGHMRASMIGQAICNLARSQGYKVIGLNHLGDWGSQFGKLAWAYQQWAHEYPVAEQPINSLFQMYVRFEKEAENNPELAKEGAKTFKKLEDGDPEIQKLWRQFVELSLKDYQRLWDMLGVQHDLVKGESFYNDRLKSTEKLLEEKGLLVESNGAMVVNLDEENMPPCLIRKSDGASLYATRDLASAIYRMEELKADINLYVVGMDQTLHFRQIFSVLAKMGYPWAAHCHHIAFGMYRFKDIGRMSTRKGNVIFTEDVLSRAIEIVTQIIEQKNPHLTDKEIVARKVGVGAVVFNDLMNDRVKNVDFDWDRVLDFEGDSGPYVQYTYVRCASLLRKYNQEVSKNMTTNLESEEEQELIRQLLAYPEILKTAFKNYKPHTLAGYLLDICHLFSQFYSKHRILGAETSVESARMTLVWATQQVLFHGLKLLSIECPEAM